MKNVAGYDCSRLMVGAFGTLGVLLDISLKVLPIPPATRTLVQACDQAEALERINGWAAKPLPITATCWADTGDGGRLWVRLAGADQGVRAAAERIGGEPLTTRRPQPSGPRVSASRVTPSSPVTCPCGGSACPRPSRPWTSRAPNSWSGAAPSAGCAVRLNPR